MNVPPDPVRAPPGLRRPGDPMWYFLNVPEDGDVEALEIVWARLDATLAAGALEERRVALPGSELIAMRLFGLVELQVERSCGAIHGFWIDRDGNPRRCLDFGWSMRNPLGGWWLRFAFHRWVPRLSVRGFEEDPSQRPRTPQLETTRALFRRLNVDRRYTGLAEHVERTLDIPEIVFQMVDENPVPSTGPDAVSEAWGRLMRVRAAIERGKTFGARPRRGI